MKTNDYTNINEGEESLRPNDMPASRLKIFSLQVIEFICARMVE
jgi:hypothetical protein